MRVSPLMAGLAALAALAVLGAILIRPAGRLAPDPEAGIEGSGGKAGAGLEATGKPPPDSSLPDEFARDPSIAVDPVSPEDPVERWLRQVASIRGIMSAPDGSPIEGAHVEVRWRIPPRDLAAVDRRSADDLLRDALARRSASARSDPSGRFELAGLLGGFYELQAEAPGYGRLEIADVPTGETVLKIFLRPELFLRGEVVDGDGKPVRVAEVRASRIASDPADLSGAAREVDQQAGKTARTDDDGRFEIGGLSAGVYRVAVERDGYRRLVVPMIALRDGAGEEEPLVFRLEKGHRIRGSVRDSKGEPISSGSVRARFLRPLPPSGDAPADEAEGGQGDLFSAPVKGGSFDLGGLPDGLYRLEIGSPSHRARSIEDVPTDGDPLEIDLADARPIDLVVIDHRASVPIAGAAVSLRPAGGEAAASEQEAASPLRTDRNGKARIENLPEGPFIIRVETEGYAVAETEPMDGEGEGELAIALDRAGSVSGRVRSVAGSPVEGLRVSLVRAGDAPAAVPEPTAVRDAESGAGSGRTGRPSWTAADGSYLVAIPEPGSYRVLVEGRPFVAASSAVIEASDPGTAFEGIDIDLRLAGAVRGRVVDPAGLPVGGAQILALPASGSEGERAATPAGEPLAEVSGRSAIARSDALGAFEVAGLREGRFVLLAAAPGFIRARSGAFDLAAGGASSIEIVLEPEMAISGIVTAADGDPIAAAEIRATVRGEGREEPWGEEATISTAPGTFRLGRLASRRYDLRVTARGFASTVIEDVSAGTARLEVRLERPVKLSGKVAGAFTGEPAAQFKLRLEFEAAGRLSPQERQVIGGWRQIHDPGGAFSIDGLPPGRYTIEVEAPGHLEAEPMALELPPGTGLAGVTIPLMESGLLGGIVLDGQALSVAGAEVRALVAVADPATGKIAYRPYSPPREEAGRDRPAPPIRVTSKDDGRFWLRDLPDGTYRLVISHDDYLTRETGDQTIQDGAGNEASLALVIYLGSGATLFGRVRRMSEIEGGALTLTLRSARGPWAGEGRPAIFKRASVDSMGDFRFRGLPAGEYVLGAVFRRSSDGTIARIEKTVRIREEIRELGVTLDLAR